MSLFPFSKEHVGVVRIQEAIGSSIKLLECALTHPSAVQISQRTQPLGDHHVQGLAKKEENPHKNMQLSQQGGNKKMDYLRAIYKRKRRTGKPFTHRSQAKYTSQRDHEISSSYATIYKVRLLQNKNKRAVNNRMICLVK